MNKPRAPWCWDLLAWQGHGIYHRDLGCVFLWASQQEKTQQEVFTLKKKITHCWQRTPTLCPRTHSNSRWPTTTNNRSLFFFFFLAFSFKSKNSHWIIMFMSQKKKKKREILLVGQFRIPKSFVLLVSSCLTSLSYDKSHWEPRTPPSRHLDFCGPEERTLPVPTLIPCTEYEEFSTEWVPWKSIFKFRLTCQRNEGKGPELTWMAYVTGPVLLESSREALELI